MAAPKTLVEYWQSEVDRIETQPPAAPGGELKDAKASRDAAAAAETAANAALATSGKAVTDAQSDVDAAKQALSGIPMPADGSPLLLNMRAALVKWRDAIATHVSNQSDLNAKRVERQRWADRVAALTDSLATANAELKNQTEIAKKIDRWVTDAGQAPLKDAKKDAGALLASGEKIAAEANVKSDFPSSTTTSKSFFDRVRARRQLAAKKGGAAVLIASDAQDQSTTWEESTTRESAKTAAFLRVYNDAVTALQGLAGSTSQLAAAKATFNKLATRTASPLSGPQKQELSDPSLKAAREKALDLLTDQDKTQSDLIDAEVAFKTSLYAAQINEPDKTEADLLVGTLKAKYDELNPAKAGSKAKALADARGKLAPQLDLLKAWFAAAPDKLWDKLDELDEAIAQVKFLSANAPADLVKGVKDAEKDLAKNLDDCRTERRKMELLNAGLAQAVAFEEAERALSASRAQAVVRFVDEV